MNILFSSGIRGQILESFSSWSHSHLLQCMNSFPPVGEHTKLFFWCYGFKSSSWYWIRIPRYWIFHLVKKWKYYWKKYQEEISSNESVLHFYLYICSIKYILLVHSWCIFRKWNRGASKIKRWYQPRVFFANGITVRQR